MPRPIVLLLAVFLLAESPMLGIDPLQPGVGWYVVRPGDTLEEITERFLGSSRRWRENWQLNPEILDPHRIRPGLRLRILVPEVLPEGSAVLERTSRRVEDLMRPHAWEAARPADILRDRDGVRTFAASSAELRLGASTRVTLTEDSLVFVGRERSAPMVRRDLIELDLGQADLRATVPVEAGAIEVVLGEARARPRSGAEASDAMRGRFRRPETGGAQLMVYGGSSELEAAGGTVDVPAGMGTSVAQSGPPAPPERLLDAPTGLDPGDGARIWAAPGPFTWSPVEGAARFAVEVCADPDCGVLLARATDLTATSWTPPRDLPPGVVYTRVTAVSPSGLDGFPSTPVRWTLAGGAADPSPPLLTLAFDGPRARMQGVWIIAPTTRIALEAEDPESGVDELEIRLDGAPVGAERLAGPWADGARHRLAGSATNGAGRKTELAEITLRIDARPPLVVAGGEIVDARLYAQGVGPPPEGTAGGMPGNSPSTGELVWRRASGTFSPLEQETLLGRDQPAVLRTDRILVRRAGSAEGEALSTERSRWAGQRVRLRERVDPERAGVWIEVLDDGAGVARVELRSLGGHRVEIRAEDALGNESRVEVVVD